MGIVAFVAFASCNSPTLTSDTATRYHHITAPTSASAQLNYITTRSSDSSSSPPAAATMDMAGSPRASRHPGHQHQHQQQLAQPQHHPHQAHPYDSYPPSPSHRSAAASSRREQQQQHDFYHGQPQHPPSGPYPPHMPGYYPHASHSGPNMPHHGAPSAGGPSRHGEFSHPLSVCAFASASAPQRLNAFSCSRPRLTDMPPHYASSPFISVSTRPPGSRSGVCPAAPPDASAPQCNSTAPPRNGSAALSSASRSPPSNGDAHV